MTFVIFVFGGIIAKQIYFKLLTPPLLSSYHHILNNHLNNASKEENDKNFEYIYNKIQNELKNECNLKKCGAYFRNNRNRFKEKEEKKKNDDKELSFWIDLLDSIHVFFCHSFDAGFRIKIDEIKHDDDYNDDNDDDDNFVDYYMEKLTLLLFEKRNNLYKMRNDIDIDKLNNKYFSYVPNPTFNKKQLTFIDLMNEELKNNVVNEDQLKKWNGFLNINNYDSEALIEDLENYDDDKKESNNSNSNIDSYDKYINDEHEQALKSNIYQYFVNDNKNKKLSLKYYKIIQNFEYNKNKEKNKNVLNVDLLNIKLFRNGLIYKKFDKWKKWVLQNEFDSESLIQDLANCDDDKNESNSNIYNYLTKNINDKIILFKYFNIIKNFKKNKNENDKQYDYNKQKNIYQFGQQMWYWKWFKNNNNVDDQSNTKYSDWYISPRYLTLKIEILSKGLSFNKFIDIYNKSKYYLNHSDTLKKIKSNYPFNNNKYYDLDLYSRLSSEHIMSCLFYTNFSELSYEFGKSHRKLSFSETDESLKKRNSSWYNMSKKLRELVECYGQPIGKKKRIFYHGVSPRMYFDKFVCKLYQPTSTTTEIEVLYILYLFY